MKKFILYVTIYYQDKKEAGSTKKKNFNKKIFSMLISRACGTRTLHKFAEETGISYVQMRKLYSCLQENPPGKKLIKKLSENSLCGVEYEDYIFAAGLDEENHDKCEFSQKEVAIIEKLRNMSSGQRRTAEEFIEFLSRNLENKL